LPFVQEEKIYYENRILQRLTEPDRIISFRVNWEDSCGNIRTNRGYRVQHNNSIGPYKGGLRFDRNLKLGTLKFLAFEQTLKNSLTGLPLGGGKGGADFNPRGKTDREVMRFCQAFMTELCRHIGPDTDVPAGDMGVGAREISYMYGQYKRINNIFNGTMTGKSLSYGGSLIRTEATGYGCVYMMQNVLQHHGQDVEGKIAVVSGSGNVAIYTTEKLIEYGARVVALSDSSGTVYDAEGISAEKLEFIKDLKNRKRGRIEAYATEYKVEYRPGGKPWQLKCDIAFPCATQNELDENDARDLVKNGCIAVAEGANMPVNKEATDVFKQAGVLLAPSKAANAGGVAVSGLEMAQNSMRLNWARDEIDTRLKKIMKDIHDNCVLYGKDKNGINYKKGANIAGFIKVADAMTAFGIC
jgi:glutamate dehydrogenase (NADP+)